MSLYADEDLVDASSSSVTAGPGPSSTPHSSAPSDPLQALAAALSCPAETPAQADALVAAAARFEENTERLPEILAQLLPMVVDGGESLLRSWTLEMVALAVGRSGLRGEVKIGVAETSLDALTRLLNTTSVPTLKAVIPIFSTIHPLLFRSLATAKASRGVYDLFVSSKSRILSLVLDATALPQNVGVKAAAWKFVQRVLMAGTRAPAVDPRLQSKVTVDPSITLITRDSLLSAAELEEEATVLRHQLVTQMYSSSDPAILHPILQTLPLLCKSRPTLGSLFVNCVFSWTPAALEASGRPAMQIRAVEKTVKMVMQHILKHPPLAAFSAQINDALVRQKQRMEAAFVTEQEERRARRLAQSQATVLGKHPAEAESSAQAAKRARLGVQLGSLGGRGVVVDVSTLPLEQVVDVVMEALEAVPLESLLRAFANARQALIDGTPDATPLLATPLGLSKPPAGDVKMEEVDEVLDPLAMDIDEDDLELSGDEGEEPMTFADFSLPPTAPLDPGERGGLVTDMMERIWTAGGDLEMLADFARDGRKALVQPKEMWMLLLARATTLAPEGKRKLISDFVEKDFAVRSKFAAIWLNEEWLAGKQGETSHYISSLDAILSTHLPKIDAKDKSLSAFLALLPELPSSVLGSLGTLCEDTDRSIVGFVALRDLIESRPPIRDSALRTLLQLCTHPNRKTRVLAISTVRRWVPSSPMSSTIVSYALGVLRRLAIMEKEASREMEVEDGEQVDEVVESRYLPSVVTPANVQQYVELSFALSRRQADLLDDIFRMYPRLDPPIQDAVETLLEPLIQSLGPSEKLLEILRDFPQGADRLVLKVVTILSAEGSNPVLVGLVKGLMEDRPAELDTRFVLPIIGELDKGEIERQIPRIVALLGAPDGDGRARDTVRTAFASVLQKMTPAELMVALHAEEGGLKSTIEAIGICFSMTTVFRADVLSSAMSRIADLPALPVVFLRTIIQAVTTYKSLVPFVANHVLPKLVAKKIWTMPQLWDGFVRLVKLIAPASFGALLQLPKEVLRDVVDRQPGLRSGLKGFIASKPQARGALGEIFGET